MKNWVNALGASVAVLGMLGATAPAFADGAAPSRIVLEIGGLRSANGSVRCSLFASPDGFPRERSKAVAGTVVAISGQQATCAFDNIAPGTYAIGFLHDENNNGKMDTNWLGIPTEGYGASRDARGKMGPPAFVDARFAYQGGVVHLRATTAY